MPIFSGDASRKFWKAVNDDGDMPVRERQDILYEFGLMAQAMESQLKECVKIILSKKTTVIEDERKFARMVKREWKDLEKDHISDFSD